MPLALPVAVLVGWSLIGSGLLAWRSHQQNYLALALIFTGFAWFASMLPNTQNPVLFTAGEAVYPFFYAGALEELRELARGIYPPVLADLGLPAALEAQARKAHRRGRGRGARRGQVPTADRGGGVLLRPRGPAERRQVRAGIGGAGDTALRRPVPGVHHHR
jgi:hypothetical protein